MEQIKRERSNIANDHNGSETKKLKVTTFDTTRSRFTQFEELSNELIYEIFEFLDIYYIFKTFSNFNTRFQHLLIDSTSPIKINILPMFKSTFQHYYQSIIIPFHHRIKALRLTNLFIFNFIFSSIHVMPKLIRLETLILENITSTYLEDLLNYLVLLPCLSSLIILPIDSVQNKHHLYRKIFRLSRLKYCKVSLTEYVESQPLPITNNEYSPIEHLVIISPIRLDEFYCLLSYVPQIRRSSLHNLETCNNQRLEMCPLVLNSLTHVSLNLNSVSFNQLEPLIINCFQKIQVLRILLWQHRLSVYEEFLNAKRWERLILIHMPYLRIFDIEHCGRIFSYQKNEQVYISALEQFSSPFWFERKWFFTQQYIAINNWTKSLFYSSNPYRKKEYVIERGEKRTTCPYHHESTLDSVHHVHIIEMPPMTHGVNYFPNATELTWTLMRYGFGSSNTFLAILTRIVSLKQITTLTIFHSFILFKNVIELLRFMPNIHSFTITSVLIEQGDSASIQKSENMITNVTIITACGFEEIQLLINLFPRMQHLTINILMKDIKPITQLLVSRISNYTCRLISLHILQANAKIMQLETIIESEKLLNDCCIRLMNNVLYLWW